VASLLLEAEEELLVAIREVRRRKPRWGVRRTHRQLRRRGLAVNRKRVERIWREHGFAVPRRRRRNKPRTAWPAAGVPVWAEHLDRC
jgi:putative transposase